MGIFKTLLKVALITAAIATGVGMLAAAGTVGAATFSLGAISLSGAAAYFATSFVTSLVLGAASYALSKNASGQNALNGSMVSTRDAVAPHKIIYGRSRVGGTVVYLESTESNKYLHSVIALAGHEIDAVEKVYFNDVEVTWDANGLVDSGNYAGKARIKFKYGTDTQTAFEDLVTESDSNWTVDHRMKGIAAAYIRLEYDSNVFPNGMPATSFLIRGKKVYDPRTSTTAWSNNPALCVADYLCDTKDGIGCVYADEIDEAALIVAANACEEQVPLAAGGYENKYEINGNFTTSTSPDQAINQMLTAMSGKAVWSSGKWRILAGIYSTPTLTFSEDDLRAGFAVQTLVSRRENFNGVKGVFPSADNNYIASDFPPVISDYFISEDGGEEVIRNIQLPFTTSASMAQRLAKIELLRARQQMTMTLPLKLNGLKVNVGDVIGVTNERFGWDAKPFEVVSSSIAIGEALGVDLELRETASNVFDWDANEESPFDAAPNTTLPNPYTVETPFGFSYEIIGLVADDGTYSVTVKLDWTASSDAMNSHYRLKVKKNADLIWNSVETPFGFSYEIIGLVADDGTYSVTVKWDGTASSDAMNSHYRLKVKKNADLIWNSVETKDNSYVFYGVEPDTYDIELYAVNRQGVESSAYTTSVIVAADTTAPSAPSGLTITSSGYQSAYLKWTNPADLDYFQTIIYASTTNNSSTATEVGRLSGTSITYSGLPEGTTYYVWLKAIDYTGNVSGFNTSQYSGTSFSSGANLYSEVSSLSSSVSGLSSDVASKVDKYTSNILYGTIVPTDSGGIKAGSITWNSTTGALTGGSGIAITEAGIIGAKSGVANFTIDTSGNATFKGDIITDGDGQFNGGSTTSFTLITNTGNKYIDYSVLGYGNTNASGKVRAGIVGYANASTSDYNVGVVGIGDNTSHGFGVYGQGQSIGGYFYCSNVSGHAIYAEAASSSALALTLGQGKFRYGSITIQPPDGLTDKYLRNDGTWASVGALGGGTVTSVSGTGTVSGLSLSGTVTTSGSLTLGGTLSLTTGNLTATAPGTAYYLSGSGWSSVSPIMTTATCNSGTATVSSNNLTHNCTISGYQFRGSGSTIYLEPVSDRNLKDNIIEESYGSDFINSLKPVTFNMKGQERRLHGFIAQDVEPLIDHINDSLKIENEDGIKGIDYISMISPLVKAFQEMSNEIKTLKDRITELESA